METLRTLAAWFATLTAVFLAAPALTLSGDRDDSASAWIRMDGSSTVFPISEAIADEFQIARRGVRITVAISGTKGGFRKLLSHEIDINNASRPINESEREVARERRMEYLELPIALDGLSVLVNPANHWVDHLTVAELRRIWEPESTVHTWRDIRAAWPEEPIRLYGPGPDSGTFAYFTDVIVGAPGASRLDYTANEDDNVVAEGIAGDPHALGYFGYAYYVRNRYRLRLVPIDGGDGPVLPSRETIAEGRYRLLSRVLFLYVRAPSPHREQLDAFLHFYLENAPLLVAQVGYVPLSERAYQLVRKRLVLGRVGSLFDEMSPDPGGITQALARDLGTSKLAE
jgi:phosphate transport system substrate-binding protein